jgi:hypothetical protein
VRASQRGSEWVLLCVKAACKCKLLAAAGAFLARVGVLYPIVDIINWYCHTLGASAASGTATVAFPFATRHTLANAHDGQLLAIDSD